MAFEVNVGCNYLTRKSRNDAYNEHGYRVDNLIDVKSADVLKIGNGLVVFQVCKEDEPTGKFKVATLSGFQKSYTDDGVDGLLGKKHNKRVIVAKCPEAAAAWE